MKTKLFFLLSFLAVFTACGEESNDSIPSMPVKVELISCDFIQEEGDIPEKIESPLIVWSSPENHTVTPFPHTFYFEEKCEETSLLTLTEGYLPEDVENLEELEIRLPLIDNSGTISDFKYGPRTSLVFGKKQEIKSIHTWSTKTAIKVTVSPYTFVTLSVQKGGYKCSATFNIVLRNIYTFEQYHLKGRWIGEQLGKSMGTVADYKIDGSEVLRKYNYPISE